MVIFPLDPYQTIAQMWSNGARGSMMTIIYISLDWCWSACLHGERQKCGIWHFCLSPRRCRYMYACYRA